MIRSVAVLLVLLAMAGPAQAQQPAVSGQTHTVLPGETLGDIARQYLGSAAAWQRLFEANQGLISDPNRIQVGMQLQIPGAATPSAQTVQGTPFAEQPAVTVQTLPYESRRELLQSRTFVPGDPVELDLDSRTIFFETQTSSDDGPIVLVQDAALIPAVPPGVFQAAGWVVPSGDSSDRLGVVAGFADDPDGRLAGASIRPFDEVVVDFLGAASPTIGEAFLTYSIRGPLDGVGGVAVPSGIIRITEVQETVVLAEVEGEFSQLQVGHFLAPLRTFPLAPGVHPSESTEGLRATLLAFQAPKVLHLPGDFAFIDQGRTDGLDVGDELIGALGDGEGTVGREVARFQVVGLQDETATVRILSVESPGQLVPGLELVLDRKMP